MNEQKSPLGRVVATERKPNTPHEFHFWTSLDSPVGIGTIVRVDGPVPVNGVIPRIYGTVIEGFSYTDLQSPLHDVMGSDGSPAGRAPTDRVEIRLYTAAVLRHIPEDPLQPVPMGEVHLADELLAPAACEAAIDEAICRIISSSDPHDFPVKPAAHCRTCNFLTLCSAGRDFLSRSA